MGQACPITWAGHVPAERKVSLFLQLPLQIAKLGGSPNLSGWVNVCLPETVHQVFHGSDAAGHPRVRMNTFFSLKRGCFRFGGFCLLACLFLFLRLLSYKASIHTVLCEAVMEQSMV